MASQRNNNKDISRVNSESQYNNHIHHHQQHHIVCTGSSNNIRSIGNNSSSSNSNNLHHRHSNNHNNNKSSVSYGTMMSSDISTQQELPLLLLPIPVETEVIGVNTDNTSRVQPSSTTRLSIDVTNTDTSRTPTTTTASTNTDPPNPNPQQQQHRRKGTNTDIASIFHMFVTRSNSNGSSNQQQQQQPFLEHSGTNIDHNNCNDDDDNDDHPTILPTRRERTTNNTRPVTTTHRTMANGAGSRYCCFCRCPSIAVPIGPVLNLCNATLGAGILALPYTFLQSGLVFGALLLLMAAIATERSIYILISVIDATYAHPTNTNTTTPMSSQHCGSYESLTQDVLDQPASTIQSESSTTTAAPRSRHKYISYRTTIEIAMLLFCCGCAVGYIMAIIDILQEFHLLFVYQNRTYTIIVVWCMAMVPLSLLHNVQSLQYASALGISAIGILIITAFVHYIQRHQQYSPDILQYTTDHMSSSDTTTKTTSSNHSLLLQILIHWRNGDSNFLWPVNGWISILTSGPVVLFAFSCQPNVCSIYDELVVTHQDEDEDIRNGSTTNPSDHVELQIDPTTTATTTTTTSTKKLQLMHRVTIVAVCICAFLYCSISIIALADFGRYVQPNILSCYTYDRNSPLIQFATAAMAFAIVMAFPLNIFPARVTVIGVWNTYCRKRQQVHSSRYVDRSISLHGIMPHESLTAAFLQDDVDEELPPTTGAHISHENGTCDPLMTTQSPLGVGGVQVLRKTNGNYYEIPPSLDDHHENGRRTIVHNVPFNRTVHIVSTLFLTTLTLILALILPNISVVFGLLGGTASSWLGFCVPGLLGIQLSKNERSLGQQSRYSLIITSWALLVGGVIIGILTTGVTIYNMMIHKQ